MNREHPTGTERKSLTYECGWKGGDRGGLAGRKNWSNGKNLWKRVKKLLTGIGLLMEGSLLFAWWILPLKSSVGSRKLWLRFQARVIRAQVRSTRCRKLEKAQGLQAVIS